MSSATAVAAADWIVEAVSGGSWSRRELACRVEQVAEEARVSRETASELLALLSLRHPSLLVLPPARGVEAMLEVLHTLAPLSEASLWMSQLGRLRCLASVGEMKLSAPARLQARRVLFGAGDAERASGDTVVALAVRRGDATEAALVIRPLRRGRRRALALAEAAAAQLGVIVERDALLHRAAEREQALVEASERRLVRVGFDLHDGPVQDLAALAIELHLFRGQLADRLVHDRDLGKLLGRLDDLEARLIAADAELRTLARSFESPQLARKALASVLRDEVDDFAARAEIETELQLDSDPHALSDSQRIAVARVVQEALANVREHAAASRVLVSVRSRRGSVRVEVRDDGRGFDVERTLVRSARAGRLGLLGMSERARLLGGTLELESRKGGPTVVALTLPEWRPLEQARTAG